MFYLICLLLGIIGLIVSLAILKRSLIFVKKGERLIGTVTGLTEIKADGDVLYAPVFELKANLKAPVVYQHPVASSPAGWVIGDKATFILDPSKPDSMRLLTYSVFSYTVIFMAIAIALMVTGAMYYVLQYHLN